MVVVVVVIVVVVVVVVVILVVVVVVGVVDDNTQYTPQQSHVTLAGTHETRCDIQKSTLAPPE